MGIFRNLFGPKPITDDPQHISFGRYSDAYKEPQKYLAWDQAAQYFDDNEYLKSTRKFFEYLSDDRLQNVAIEEKEGKIHFKILQGSKRIIGESGIKFFKAEAKVAKVINYNIAFLRRLLELNYSLKYCRYALDPDDNLTIVFYSQTIDASPYKVYYALKELATQSDKQDDILEGEFDTLLSINKEHIKPISDHDKKIKYAFFKESISQTLDLLDKTSLNLSSYPGAESFVLLDVAYKLDYLVKPEGYIMEAIEKAHRNFFSSDGKNAVVKNNILRKQIAHLLERTEDQFNEEMYEVVSSFGITMPTGHDRFAELLDNNIKNIEWYGNQGHRDVAQCITSYVVGYCLFNYSLPSPITAMLKLFYHINNETFFENLGYKQRYWEQGQLSRNQIVHDIKELIEKYRSEYGLQNANVRALAFDDQLSFSKSFLLMLRDLQTIDKTKSE